MIPIGAPTHATNSKMANSTTVTFTQVLIAEAAAIKAEKEAMQAEKDALYVEATLTMAAAAAATSSAAYLCIMYSLCMLWFCV